MENDGLAHCCRNLPLGSNSSTLPVPVSAVHRLPLWSTATPARLTKWPCGVVLPSIVDMKTPLASNFTTTLLPASPTNTLLAAAPLVTLLNAMLVGSESWPGPEPGIPAWQLAVQTSLCAAPSATPHPQAARKLPLTSNFSTRALPLSAMYTAPFDCWIDTPTGVWSWPAPEPGLPNELTFCRNDRSVWNVVSAPFVVPAAFVATTRK